MEAFIRVEKKGLVGLWLLRKKLTADSQSDHQFSERLREKAKKACSLSDIVSIPMNRYSLLNIFTQKTR